MSTFNIVENETKNPEKLDKLIAELETYGLGVVETHEKKSEAIHIVSNRSDITSSGALTIGPLDPWEKIIQPEREVENNDLANGRWYHEIGNSNVDEWVPSVTTILSVLRKGHGFNIWNRNYGHLAPLHRDLAAIRGSIVHYYFKVLVEGETVTAEEIWNHIQMEPDQSWKTLTTQKTLLYQILRYLESFVAFWNEKEPEPVACEYPVLTPTYGGRLDLIVEFKKAKNSKKKSRCLMDLKTGGSYFSHALQNSAYKHAWEEEHPDMPIHYMAGIYVTSEYRKHPTYKIGWQKDMFDIFKATEKVWYAYNASARDGKVTPRLSQKPRNEFNLYKKEKEPTNGISTAK